MTKSGPKTGADHIKSIDDGREVYLNGALIEDPINHPAFRNAIQSAAGLYDYQVENQDLMTFASPSSGPLPAPASRPVRSMTAT